MPDLTPIQIRNLGVRGVVRQAEVEYYLAPEGSVAEAQNVHFDRKGAVSLRLGETILGTAIVSGATYPCLGLHDSIFANGTSGTLLAVFSNGSNNIISKFNGSTWSDSLTGDTAGAKTRFTTFADRVIRVNGSDGSMKCWAGGDGAWETEGPPVNPNQIEPYKPKFIEVYKGAVYMAGDSTYPDRLLWSSVIDSTGTITFTLSEDFEDINPNDGENITGLRRYSLELDIFKPNYIYRFRTSAVDSDPLIKIGTRSNESIIEGKKGLYFHHESGFYRYTGSYPTEISRPISDFVSAIPFSYMSNITSWRDTDHIYWSVGDLTIDAESWTNVVLCFTESSEVWTIYSYATEVRWATRYNDGTNLLQVVGDDTGSVYKVNSGNSDNGTPIPYKMITHWYDFGNLAERKHISEIISYCEDAQGSRLQYQIDGSKNWQPIGQIRQFLNFHDGLDIKFHRIRFKVYGTSNVAPFIFQGLTIEKAENLGITKE